MKQLTPMQSVAGYLDQELERRKEAMLNAYAYVAESCLAEMRSNYNYQDKTGNLTSSKGYGIVVDGRIWKKSDFESIKEGRQGSTDGEVFLNQLASRFPTGIVLIVVAGMNYSYFVSAKGYNVADSAETLALRMVPQIMRDLGFNKR